MASLMSDTNWGNSYGPWGTRICYTLGRWGCEFLKGLFELSFFLFSCFTSAGWLLGFRSGFPTKLDAWVTRQVVAVVVVVAERIRDTCVIPRF